MFNNFAYNLESFADSTAIISGGKSISYISLAKLADEFSSHFPKNQKQLFLLAAENSLECIVAYLAALRSGIPVILTPHDKPDTFENIRNQFKPTITYSPLNGNYALQHHAESVTADTNFPSKLSVLLSTSGTTGSAKLVKLTVNNIDANAKSIAQYLQLDASERAIVSLPMYYSYGLSVINSHLSIGASLVLSDNSVIDDCFWRLFNQHECTSFAGVPYSYELLKRSGFESRQLPTLRYMTQAGGKLPKELVEYYASLGQENGWRFFVMYGQTEATARMSYLPPDKVLSHSGSIGIAVPQGRFELIDEKGQPITAANQRGELVYHGPNVMMNYASNRDDLFEDSSLAKLLTGDIAWRDKDGLYYISGRKSRFLKMFGNRIGLDDMESYLRGLGYVTICGGTDKHLVVLTIDQGVAAEIQAILANKFSLTGQYATVEEVENFPLLPSGKINYATLIEISEVKDLSDAANRTKQSKFSYKSVLSRKNAKDKLSTLDIFSKVFTNDEVTEESSFVSLNGDSLNYVQTMILLENKFGQLPDDWQKLSVREFEHLRITPEANYPLVETNIVLRAIAILAILLNHSGAVESSYVAGGAAFLMLLAGYSFARFQSEMLLSGKVWETIWHYLRKILIPYMGICLGYFLYQILITKQTPDYDLIFMVSNFYRPQADGFASIWFLQALTQCFVVFGLIFSIKKLRNYAKNNIWQCSLLLLVVFSFFSFLIELNWSAKPLDFRVPQIYIPLMMMGWCIYVAKSSAQKLVLFSGSVLFLLVMRWLNVWGVSHYVWLATGTAMLLFLPKINIFRSIKANVNDVAASAYEIFLVHIWILQVVWHFIRQPQLRFLVLLTSCVLAVRLYKKCIVAFHEHRAPIRTAKHV